jgi:hypothetical protein
MGLVRLLSMGKTFGAATNQGRRYREWPGGGLPKLGTVPAKLETGMKKTTKVTTPEAPRETAVTPSQPGSGPAPAAARNSGASSFAGSALSWWQEAGRFLLGGWGRKKTRPTRRAPVAASAPVQQELALENVKPCCNDLSDADWEMVSPPVSERKPSLFRKWTGGGKSASPFRAEASTPASTGRF